VDGGGRVQDGDADFGDGAGYDGGFALRACPVCQEREYDAFEEGGGFVESGVR
jgi:hypothetical protein